MSTNGRKFLKQIAILIFGCLMLLCMAGCFSYKEVAGYYKGDNGDWLRLDFDADTKDKGGEIYVDATAYDIFWDYDIGNRVLEITAWEYVGGEYISFDDFRYYDLPATYENGVIQLEYYGNPKTFVKTGESVEDINDVANFETSQETAWLSKEQASQNGGFYIMDGDKFYPLGKCWGMDTYYYSPAEYVVAAKTVDVPVVSSDTQLVLFTTQEVGKIYVMPTGHNGYTLPLSFRDYEGMNGEKENKLYLDRLYYYTDTYPEIINQFSDSEFSAASDFNDTRSSSTVIEEFDGQNAIESADLVAVAGYHFLDEYAYILDCEEDQVVSIGYSIGSSWYETSFRACAKYWEYIEDDKIEMVFDITKEGYFVVDTSSLVSGTYLMQYTGDSYWANYTDYEGGLFLVD